MKYNELLEQVVQMPLFTSGILQVGDVNSSNLQKQLSRWTASEKILQLRRGLYMLAEPYRQMDPHPFLIANNIVSPSYVSLQSALAYYDLITESVPEVNSITSRRRSKRITTQYGTFNYRHIQSDLFFGYHLLEVAEEQYVYIAKPEKALLDLIYLTPRGNEVVFLESLRLQNLEKLDLDWMREITNRLGMKKLIAATENIAQLLSRTFLIHMSGRIHSHKKVNIKDSMTLDIKKIRADFPILKTIINGKPLVYLDNAATTQKPQCVIDAITNYYTTYNSNIHRGTHYLSNLATEAHEDARKTVQAYINAKHEHEVVFTRGTTEAINLVAFSFGEAFIQPGDDVIVTEMDHHSNFVPWQMLCQRCGANFRVVPFDENGELRLDILEDLLCDRTRIVAFNHVSNSLGTVNPARKIIEMAHDAGAAALVDAAQAIQHIEHDVQALDADFYAFSGHKMYGPTGIGVLYGKEKWLDAMPPYQGGGEMIDLVSVERTTYNKLPFKFEAGTPNIVGPIGLAAAIDYINALDFKDIMDHEEEVFEYGIQRLLEISELTLYGNAKRRTSILPFNIKGVHHYDLGTLLDTYGVAVRTGHHCTQPIMTALGIEGTVRASLALYNTKEDIDALIAAIQKAMSILGK